MVTLLLLLMAGCSDDNDPGQSSALTDRSSFMMYIYLPNGSSTRSEDYSRTIYIDKPFERTINSLRVWIFARNSSKELIPISDDDGAVNGALYVNVGSIDTSVDMKDLAFDVEAGFNNRYPYVDIYVVANIESLGEGITDNWNTWCSPKNTESLQDMENRIESLQLDANTFGVGSMVSDASTTGLPMSGYIKEAEVQTQGVVYTTMNIKVLRAVSKLRFVFAKSPTTPEAAITSVKLNAGMIPTTEYLFSGTADANGVKLPATGNSYGSTYNSSEIDFGAPASIKTNVMPSRLNWSASTNRQDWEDAMNAAISNNEATEHVRAYLHESDKRLIGTIKYKLTTDGAEKSATFQMSESPSGQFLRNSSWTVYAYFTEGGLVYEVANWDEQEVTYKPFI